MTVEQLVATWAVVTGKDAHEPEAQAYGHLVVTSAGDGITAPVDAAARYTLDLALDLMTMGLRLRRVAAESRRKGVTRPPHPGD